MPAGKPRTNDGPIECWPCGVDGHNEVSLKEMKSIAEYQEAPKRCGHSVKYRSTEGPIWGLASSHRVTPKAEERDLGQ
jgi:hypothetical protein